MYLLFKYLFSLKLALLINLVSAHAVDFANIILRGIVEQTTVEGHIGIDIGWQDNGLYVPCKNSQDPN